MRALCHRRVLRRHRSLDVRPSGAAGEPSEPLRVEARQAGTVDRGMALSGVSAVTGPDCGDSP